MAFSAFKRLTYKGTRFRVGLLVGAIEHEPRKLADPAVRATAPSSDAQALGYHAILKVVQQEHPEAVVQSISRPVKSQLALTVRVSYPDATTASLYVISYDEQILVRGKLGEDSTLTFKKPKGEFYILFDARPGHVVEIDYTEIDS